MMLPKPGCTTDIEMSEDTEMAYAPAAAESAEMAYSSAAAESANMAYASAAESAAKRRRLLPSPAHMSQEDGRPAAHQGWKRHVEELQDSEWTKRPRPMLSPIQHQ